MTEDEIIAFIRQGLARAKQPQAFLAKLLGIDGSQISRMIGKPADDPKKRRSVSAAELDKIADALNLERPRRGGLRTTDDFGGVPVRGRLAQGTWMAEPQTMLSTTKVGAVYHPRYPLRTQSAYQVDAEPMPGEDYSIGDFVIAVPFAEYRSKPLPGDQIIVRRQRGVEVNYTLYRAVEEGGKVVIKPVLKGDADSSDGEFFGLVISRQQHFF